MDDEIKLRAGLDTSGFDQAESGMRSKLGALGEHGHKSFIHASNGAREFHKLIHSMNDEVPILGRAFQFLTSPVGAFLSLATIGFAKLSEKISEMNKEMFEEGTKASQPIANIVKIIKSGQEAVEKFNQKFNEWKYQPAKDKTTENLEKKLTVLKAIEQHAIQNGGDKDAIAKASAGAQLQLQNQAISALTGGAGEAGKSADFWGGEMRKHLTNRVVENAQANIKQQQEHVESLKAKQRQVEAQIEDVRNPGLSSPWFFQTQEARTKQADLMERTRLNPITNQIGDSEKLIEENQKAVDREMRNRESVASKIKDFQTERDNKLTQAGTITKSRDETALRLQMMNGGGPLDMRNASMKSTDDWLAAHQGALGNWNLARDRATQSFVDRLNPYKAQAAASPTSVEGMLKSINEQLEALNKIANTGITVVGADK